MTYRVVEIFDSIDGEGIRTGQPVSFVRLAGCNLRCSYCDTLYALYGEAEPCRYTEMTGKEILEKLNPSYRRVTLTGGEPLIAEGAADLVNLMMQNGFEVNIETNGAAALRPFEERLKDREKLFYTIDYKLPSSGMEEKMLWENFLLLEERDVIKFVVGDERDTKVMLDVLSRLSAQRASMPHLFIGAVYGSYDAQKLVDLILSEPLLRNARFQVQLHKMIWDPDKRGV